MDLPLIFVLMAAFGALGGFVNCLIAGELVWWQFDGARNVWRPGWIGNVIIGAVAAVVVGGMNSSLSGYNLIGTIPQVVSFTIGQLLSSVVVGIGGGKILTLMAEKQADMVSKKSMVESVEKLSQAKSERQLD